MRTLLTTLAFVAMCTVISYRAVRNHDEQAEQREAVYARDGETVEDARARIELEPCTSSEFGHCHRFPVEVIHASAVP